ncbi:flavodoxin family protein [Streptococcus macacae]|uniref:Flavin reductase n=1 Tax=Streptococcus macacae NCTC 11558 TaxID=764298 RepID=G5JZ43_9STRE|nr:NAD(P)H-dependent oxidoreductase [Streptococcus macacae]EHJ52066.1 flavin reductase [Streptococcus macacae NCTC 11558]SUN78296.1 NAD(P)H dehydrogenase (quinone) [Streptococcus macacae NCTC 11558]
MSILFINASPNKNGNTSQLAKQVLAEKNYGSLQLIDYKIYDYGQDFPDDQLEEVLAQVLAADTLVIGSPVYWHSFTGLLPLLMFLKWLTIP